MNVKNPHIIWASVVIVVTLVAGVVTLSLNNRDTNAILTLVAVAVIPVLVGFGAVFNQKVDKMQEQVNGNNNRLLTQVLLSHQQAVELAKQAPAAPPVDIKEEEPWPGASGSSPTR